MSFTSCRCARISFQQTLHLAAGNSVCAFVHGFEPYFYVEAPPAFGPDDCDSLRSQLNVRVF